MWEMALMKSRVDQRMWRGIESGQYWTKAAIYFKDPREGIRRSEERYMNSKKEIPKQPVLAKRYLKDNQ